MATTRRDIRNAQADYRLKIRLERGLSRKMVRLFNTIAKDTQNEYVKKRNILWVPAYLANFVEMLEKHYHKVAKVFRKRINTGDIILTENEVAQLEKAISINASTNADVSGRQIVDTLQKDVNTSFEETRTEALKAQEAMTTRKVAATAKAKLKQKSIERARKTIPITETQQAAEQTKQQTANAHHTAEDKPAHKTAIKTWHTVGDERVREAHRQANLQTQHLDTPYEVAGELLMQPGDSSLGASPANTINCRCSSQYTFN